MQFRLDGFKNEQQKVNNQFKSENVRYRNTFYTKILSNTNIGIEFYKPSL